MKWEGGQTATLAAFEGYWQGRPFLDTIEIQMNRDPRDQAQDMRLGKADCVDAPAGTRIGPDRTIVALVFESTRATPEVREAISLAIDRIAIRRVLLKDRGEISGALLPQWLSGYAFLFDNKRDAARAHQLGAGAVPLNFAYDRQDAVLRPIAERISGECHGSGDHDAPGARFRGRSPGCAAGDLARWICSAGRHGRASQSADGIIGLVRGGSLPGRADNDRLAGDVLPLFQLTRSWSVARRPQLAGSGERLDWPTVTFRTKLLVLTALTISGSVALVTGAVSARRTSSLRSR